jgi:hypothetical protein
MKKLTIIFSLCGQLFFAQDILIDSCGLDDKSRPSTYEVNYFNQTFSRDSFNFADKKIAFTYGNFGKTIVSKKKYFIDYVKPWVKNGGHPSQFLLVLTTDEKIKSGGFDAIIVVWSKVLVNQGHKQKILRRLRRQNVSYQQC